MMDDLVENYRLHLKRKGFSPKSIETYIHALTHFLGFLDDVGVVRPDGLTRETIVAYQEALYTGRSALGRPLALRTQALWLMAVMGFLKYLVREGVLLLNPGEDIELPRFGPRNPPRSIPTEAEVEALLAAPDKETPLGLRDSAMLEVLYSTGMRVGELVRLKVYDVELTRGLVRIIGGKGGKDRTVPLGRVAVRAVKAYLEKVRPRYVRSGKTNTLFVSFTGRRLWPTAVQRQVRIYTKRAGIEKRVTAHSLRHACASHMLRGKASIRHIQEQLGHRQLSTTQLYTHVEIEDLKAVHSRTHPRERPPKTRK
ncbi:MAG: tyrosine-type recombinase/integrase [Thermodesulfobacteriota bacterium]